MGRGLDTASGSLPAPEVGDGQEAGQEQLRYGRRTKTRWVLQTEGEGASRWREGPQSKLPQRAFLRRGLTHLTGNLVQARWGPGPGARLAR